MVQRYNPDYVMHAARFAPFARENEHGEFVKFSDYEVLKAERDALAQRVEMLAQNLGNAIWGEQEALQRVNALAVENAGFKHALSVILEHVDVTDKGQAGVVAMIANDELFNSETPATDAALSAIEARAKAEAFAEIIEFIDRRSGIAEMKTQWDLSSAIVAHITELREAK